MAGIKNDKFEKADNSVLRVAFGMEMFCLNTWVILLFAVRGCASYDSPNRCCFLLLRVKRDAENPPPLPF